MSARSFLLPAVAIWLTASVGCQSMFRGEDTFRGQSPPGLGGGIPKPPTAGQMRQPGDGLEEETILEQISGTVGDYFKPDPDGDKAKARFAEADDKFRDKEYATAISLYQEAADLAPGRLRRKTPCS